MPRTQSQQFNLQEKRYARVMAQPALNLRAKPGTLGDVINQIPYGACVEIVEGAADSAWVLVNYAGAAGYVLVRYLQLLQPGEEPTSQPVPPAAGEENATDTGEKICKAADALCAIGVILFCLIGLSMLLMGMFMSYGGGVLVIVGLVIAVVGSLVTWILSLFMRGFGEIINELKQANRQLTDVIREMKSRN